MQFYLAAMGKYVTFAGRSSRKEFWRYTLVVFLISVFAARLDKSLGTDGVTNVSGSHPGLLFSVWYLVHAIPSLSVSIRRLHDIDRSGWWLLIAFTGVGSIVLFVFTCLRGTVGPNRFGSDPYAPVTAAYVEPAMGDVQSEFYAPTPASIREMPPVRAPDLRRRQDEHASDPIAEIERLAYLRQEGDISDAEFEVLKARALSRAR